MSDEYEQNQEDYSYLRLVWIIFTALSAPFLLLPVEIVFPYPHIVEELFKLMIVVWLLKLDDESERGVNWLWSVVVGLLFGVSETMFFVFDAFAAGSFSSLVGRLMFTVPMHALTTTIMYIIGRRSKGLIVLGLIIGVVVHYVFNRYFVI